MFTNSNVFFPVSLSFSSTIYCVHVLTYCFIYLLDFFFLFLWSSSSSSNLFSAFYFFFHASEPFHISDNASSAKNSISLGSNKIRVENRIMYFYRQSIKLKLHIAAYFKCLASPLLFLFLMDVDI